jgi:hypothetical protein
MTLYFGFGIADNMFPDEIVGITRETITASYAGGLIETAQREGQFQSILNPPATKPRSRR